MLIAAYSLFIISLICQLYYAHFHLCYIMGWAKGTLPQIITEKGITRLEKKTPPDKEIKKTTDQVEGTR